MIDDESVYQCVGNPTPTDVERMLDCLLKNDFDECYKAMSDLQIKKGIATLDMIHNVVTLLRTIEMSVASKIVIYDTFARIEERLGKGCNEKIQMGAFISAVKVAIELN